jgi:hypothetical protein
MFAITTTPTTGGLALRGAVSSTGANGVAVGNLQGFNLRFSPTESSVLTAPVSKPVSVPAALPTTFVASKATGPVARGEDLLRVTAQLEAANSKLKTATDRNVALETHIVKLTGLVSREKHTSASRVASLQSECRAMQECEKALRAELAKRPLVKEQPVGSFENRVRASLSDGVNVPGAGPGAREDEMGAEAKQGIGVGAVGDGNGVDEEIRQKLEMAQKQIVDLEARIEAAASGGDALLVKAQKAREEAECELKACMKAHESELCGVRSACEEKMRVAEQSASVQIADAARNAAEVQTSLDMALTRLEKEDNIAKEEIAAMRESRDQNELRVFELTEDLAKAHAGHAELSKHFEHANADLTALKESAAATVHVSGAFAPTRGDDVASVQRRVDLARVHRATGVGTGIARAACLDGVASTAVAVVDVGAGAVAPPADPNTDMVSAVIADLKAYWEFSATEHARIGQVAVGAA